MRPAAVLSLLVLVATGVRADPEAPAPGPRLVFELERLRRDGATVEALASVARLAGEATSTREGLASLIETGRFELRASAGAAVKWPGGEVGAEVSGGTIQGSLPLTPIASAQASVGERRMGVATSTRVLDAGGTQVKVSGAVEAEYATNKDFFAALPVPGLRQMHALLERRLGEPEATAAAAGTDPIVERFDRERAAVLAAQEAAEAVRAATGWVVPKEASFQSSVSVAQGHAEVSASHGMVVSFSDPQRPTRPIDDLTIRLSRERGFEGDAAKGLSASIGVGLALTFKGDPGTKASPEALETARALRVGDDARVVGLALSSASPLAMTPADAAVAKEVFERSKDAASLAVGQIVSREEPVGGVRLHFHPAATGVGWTPGEYAEMLREVARLRAEGRTSFALQPAETRRLVRVPLEDVLRAESVALTRVLGYVVGSDRSIHLVGEADPTRERVPTDHFVVALNTVFSGTSPFVSLDPDPDDPSGPQKVRVGGIPPPLRRTAFVRTMLEADALMKRLDLGAERAAGAPGYRSTVDLLETWPTPPHELASRMWLVPDVAPVGDVLRHADERGEVVVFRSRITVMTETLRRMGSTLVGVGATNPLNEAGAASFAAHLPEMARRPEGVWLARLEQVFDVAKVVTLWRAAKLDHPLFAQIAARAPALVDHPDSYPGVGPVFVRGGAFSLSGGAVARVRPSRRPPTPDPSLAPLLAGRPTEVSFPRVLPLGGADLSLVDAELLANAAVEHGLHGRLREAVDAASLALEADPDLGTAYAARALARDSLGERDLAIEDARRAAASDPSRLGLLATIEARAGRSAEARAHLDAFESALGDDDAAVEAAAYARLLAEDWAGAGRLSQRLSRIAPLSHAALNLRDLLDDLYRRGPEGAAKRVAWMRAVPPPIRDALARSREAISRKVPAEAVEHLRLAVELARAARLDPALHVSEACRYDLAKALAASAVFRRASDPFTAEREVAEGRELAGALAREHPDWASARLLEAQLSGDAMTTRKRLAVLERALAKPNPDDPLLRQEEAALGSTRVLAFRTLTAFLDPTGRVRPDGDRDEVLRFLSLVVRGLGDAPEAAPYRVLHDLLGRPRWSPKLTPAETRAYLEAILAIPTPWPDDGVGVLATANLYYTGLAMTGEIGLAGTASSNADLAPRLLARLAEGARVDGLRETVLLQVSNFYWLALSGLAERDAADVAASEDFRRLLGDLPATWPDPAAVRATIQRLRDLQLARRAPDLTPFATAYVRAIDATARDGLEKAAVHAFGVSAPGRPLDDLVRARDLATEWEEDLARQGESAETATAIARLAESATCEVEASAVLHLLDDLEARTRHGGAFGPVDPTPEATTRWARIRHAVSTRLRAHAKAPKHDWSGWPTGGTGPASR